MVNEDCLPNLQLTVKETLARWPATNPVLLAYGLDTCCGGAHTVAKAAAAHGVDPDLLLAELLAAVEAPA